MRNVGLGRIGLVGIFASFVLPLHGFASDSPRKLAGDIVSTDGAVFVRVDGEKDSPLKPLKPGDSIYTQDIVNTGSDGHVKILMQDKSIMDLGPSSLFKVDSYVGKKGDTDRQVQVSIPYGTMRAAISQKLTGKGKFQVRTPSATMGVRGTEFVVKSELKDPTQVGKFARGDSSWNSSGNASSVGGRGPASIEGASTQVTVLQGQVDVGRQNFDTSGGSRSPSSVVSMTAGSQLSTLQSDSHISEPVQVDHNQMAAVSSSSKIVDNTFSKAVVIDNAGMSASSKSSSGPNGPSAPSAPMQQVVAAAVQLPPPPPLSPKDIGIPGAINNQEILAQQPVNQLGVGRKLRVVIYPQ